jgi:hypothetical protein
MPEQSTGIRTPGRSEAAGLANAERSDACIPNRATSGLPDHRPSLEWMGTRSRAGPWVARNQGVSALWHAGRSGGAGSPVQPPAGPARHAWPRPAVGSRQTARARVVGAWLRPGGSRSAGATRTATPGLGLGAGRSSNRRRNGRPGRTHVPADTPTPCATLAGSRGVFKRFAASRRRRLVALARAEPSRRAARPS